MQEYKKQFIEFLVKSNALAFGEFTLKSGRVAPYFINAGSFDTGEKISKLGSYYASALVDSGAVFDVVFGPAYKGIPLALTTVINLNKSHGINAGYAFNRKEAKDHGDTGMLVGHVIAEHMKIVIVDDVMTSGKAIKESFALLAEYKPRIEQVLVSVDRMERGLDTEKGALAEVSAEFGVRVSAIVTIRDILAHLHNNEIDGTVYIGDSEKEKIEIYLNAYGVEPDTEK